jgi:voltage-gated potassium channel
MNIRHLRAKLFNILHKPSPENPAARYANYFLAFLIFANALFVALETVPALASRFAPAFKAFEAASTALFALEYAARLWVCTEQGRYSRRLLGRLAYAAHPLPLLDLIVIATYWLPIDLRFLRVARMVRLLKVLRLDHFEESLHKVGAGLRRRTGLIFIAVTMMVLCIYASSALIYQLEHTAQPAAFSSIPGTFWWALVTLTTIGYGDMVPLTPAGKLFAGFICIFGIGIFALPTAIVTAVIVEAGVSDPEPPRPLACRHCGKPWHPAQPPTPEP